MAKPSRAEEVEALIREIQRYLGFLEALRKAPGPPAAGEQKKSG